MADENLQYNQKVFLGCGILFFLLCFGVGLMMVLALNQDRQAARYPDAIPVSSHSNYTGLPYHFRWDNAYRTTDAFPKVYNWYSTRFDLGAEARANGGCILLEGTLKQLTMKRHMSVLLCDAHQQRMIFVTRSTSLK